MLRLNNFDLIRLLASVQVFFMHSVAWLNLPISPIAAEALDWFPGVPIFFMISGLLVTHSFMRLPTLRQYVRHRALRIFPGLWMCLVISFMFAAWQGHLTTSSLFLQTMVWAAMQGSFFQFVNFHMNPGVTNGVLWSIATELQFYIALPLVVTYCCRFLRGRMGISVALIVFAAASTALHQWVLSHQDELLPKLFPILYASILANGYLFALGALAYLWQDKLLPLCRGKFVIFLAAYLAARLILITNDIPSSTIHSSMWALVVYPVLGLVVYSFAFSYLGLSQRVLRSNDFSYGIYIYHMPVIYMSLHMEWKGVGGLVVTTFTVALLAAFSWFLIERPTLKLKQDTHLPASESRVVGTP